jgi:hypothetical protein
MMPLKTYWIKRKYRRNGRKGKELHLKSKLKRLSSLCHFDRSAFEVYILIRPAGQGEISEHSLRLHFDTLDGNL